METPFFAGAETDLVEQWKQSVRTRFATRHAGSLWPRVRVTPGFMLLALVAGAASGVAGALATALALTAVLLAQEMPRALLAAASGQQAKVELNGFGGHTELPGPQLRGASVVGFATIGSLVNGALAGVLVLVARSLHEPSATGMLRSLALGQLVWAVLHLSPVAPSHLALVLVQRLRPQIRVAHAVGSACVLWLAAVSAEPHRSVLTLALFAISLAGCGRVGVEAYRSSRDRSIGLEDAIARARQQLARGEPEPVARFAQDALQVARSLEWRRELYVLLAWASIGKGDPFMAHAALQALPERALDPYLLAAYLRCCNRRTEALELLDDMHRLGYRSRETVKLMLELSFALGDFEKVRAIAAADSELLTSEDLALLRQVYPNAGA